MFCPACGSEYRPEIKECSDCGVPLVPAPPEPAAFENTPLDTVTVFSASDAALVALARSILESAGIPFAARNEGVQDLFGLGRMAGFNQITGPVTFEVPAEHAEEARMLLDELEQGRPEDLDTHYGPEER
jgi:hypothetical protein